MVTATMYCPWFVHPHTRLDGVQLMCRHDHQDINSDCTKLVSSGLDNSLRIWSLREPGLVEAIERSRHHFPNVLRAFRPAYCDFPIFMSRAVHRNYIDCVRWCGDMLLSKSVDNRIIMWKPAVATPRLTDVDRAIGDPVVFLGNLVFDGADIWYVRFNMDPMATRVAIGNMHGTIYVWGFDKITTLRTRAELQLKTRQNSTIRSVVFSRDSQHMLAVHDNGAITHCMAPSPSGALPGIPVDEPMPDRVPPRLAQTAPTSLPGPGLVHAPPPAPAAPKPKPKPAPSRTHSQSGEDENQSECVLVRCCVTMRV
jgi:WD40 repeat protein